jgi:hypothetical protein
MVRYVRNGFEGGKSITKAIFLGGGLKIETFLGPEMATSVAEAPPLAQQPTKHRRYIRDRCS